MNDKELIEKLQNKIKEFERKEQTQLSLENALFYAIIKNFPFQFFMINKHEEITIQNSISQNYFGNLLYQNITTIAQNNKLFFEWSENYKQAMRGEANEVVNQMIYNQTKIYLKTTFLPMLMEDEITGVLCFSFDISEIKNYERKLNRNKEMLMMQYNEIQDQNVRLKKLNSQYLELNKELMKATRQAGAVNLSLKESEERFRHAFEYAAHGEALINLDNKLIQVNGFLCRMLGYKKDELLNKKITDIIYENDLEKRQEVIERLLKNEIKYAWFEIRYKHKQNYNIWAYVSTTIISNSNNKPLYFVSQIQDITEKKIAARSLMDSEEKYRTLIEKSNDAIIIQKDLAILFANNRFFSLTSYDDSHVLGEALNKFVPENEIQKWKNYYEKKLSNKEAKDIFESQLIAKNQKLIPVEVNNTVIKYEDHKVILTIIRDLSNRKQAEKQLRLFGSIIEQIDEGILVTDTTGEINYMNPAYENITGHSFSEFHNQKQKLQNVTLHNDKFSAKFKEIIENKQTWSGKIQSKQKNGKNYDEHIFVSPIKNAKNEVQNFVVIARNISDEIQKEKQLRQAQKLQAIGTLAGGIAHDFNNIVMGIQINTELLKFQIEQNDELAESIQEIENNCKRAKGLVEQILTFGHQKEPKTQPLLIHIVVKESIKMIAATLPATIKIIKRISDVGYVLISPTQIHQIIMNLCTNAGHAMRGTGTLTIELKQIQKRNSNQNEILLKVSDTGQGMDTKTKERIFEPFFTTKKVGEGTGLGLATVHGIVKQVKGQIIVESEQNVGTTFFIYLPKIENNK